MLGAVAIGAAWLAAAAGLAAAATSGALPVAAEGFGVALAVSVVVMAPAGAIGLAAWLRAEARREAARLFERVAAVDAALAAAVEAAGAEDAAPPSAAGVDGETLGRALSNAAREALDGEREAIARRMAELAETQRRLDAAVAALSEAAAVPAPLVVEAEAMMDDDAALEALAAPRASVPAAPPRPAEEDARQPGLPLVDDEIFGDAGLDWGVVAAALDFPRHAGDADGFAALDAARRDRGAGELLQAAEDALTLLSQKGLYMEDLAVRHASSETWRRFAQGERGPAVRAAGGVEAPDAVATVRELMKSDPVFRDTALHLMRRYDALLRRTVEAPEGEARLLSLADSRTGRAFMTVAQASGVFD